MANREPPLGRYTTNNASAALSACPKRHLNVYIEKEIKVNSEIPHRQADCNAARTPDEQRKENQRVRIANCNAPYEH